MNQGFQRHITCRSCGGLAGLYVYGNREEIDELVVCDTCDTLDEERERLVAVGLYDAWLGGGR